MLGECKIIATLICAHVFQYNKDVVTADRPGWRAKISEYENINNTNIPPFISVFETWQIRVLLVKAIVSTGSSHQRHKNVSKHLKNAAIGSTLSIFVILK